MEHPHRCIEEPATLDGLREQLFYDPEIRKVKEINTALEDRIDQILSKLKIEARIQNVGSTNPSRSTFVLDDSVLPHSYPPDFDVDIITKEKLGKEKIERIVEGLFSHYSYKRTGDGNVHNFSHRYDQDFSLSIAILDEETAQREAPDIYCASLVPLTPGQSLDIRTLKLTLMRIGAYGRYNHAVSGIATEELIRKYGSVDNVLAVILDRSLEVVSPVDGKNLIANVSSDVWKRVYDEARNFRQTANLKSYPFSEWDWIYAHPDSHIFFEQSACSPISCGRDGAEIYAACHRFLTQALEECVSPLKNFRLYVIPCRGSVQYEPHTDIYVALGNASQPIDNAILESFIGKLRRYEKL